MAKRTEATILSDGPAGNGACPDTCAIAADAGTAQGTEDTTDAGEDSSSEALPPVTSVLFDPDDDDSDRACYQLDEDDVDDALDLLETAWRTINSTILKLNMTPHTRRVLQNHAHDIQAFLEQFVDLDEEKPEEEERPVGWRRL